MPFDSQPFLKGNLIELRPLQNDDYDSLFAVASDPLVWEQHPENKRYEEAVFKEFFREAMESGGALLAIDAETKQVIGSSRYHGYDEDKSEIEIGWTFLSRSCWGGKYNYEMKQLMLKHAFRFVKSVIFVVGINNIRSQRAVEKIGGVKVGIKKDKSGKENYVYRLTASAEIAAG